MRAEYILTLFAMKISEDRNHTLGEGPVGGGKLTMVDFADKSWIKNDPQARPGQPQTRKPLDLRRTGEGPLKDATETAERVRKALEE